MKMIKKLHKSKPIKFWLDDLEYSAMIQAFNVAKFPDIFRHVVILPDAHAGMGVPIGCVFATESVIVPNAVGIDIGCGVSAIKLNVSEGFIRKNATALFHGIDAKRIRAVRRKRPAAGAVKWMTTTAKSSFVDEEIKSKALVQMGTLGGGNHFIEFQKDQNNNVWLMIHSGSRNLGQKIGKHYDKLAVEFNRKSFSSVDPKHKLAFLPVDSTHGMNYITDMVFAAKYAQANRAVITADIVSVLNNILGYEYHTEDALEQVIDCSHNFARLENHFGKNVWVHRKGATIASEGILALIPGSQGTSSYIVKGKGNKESFNSCSHGAGRVLSRSKAKSNLDLEFERLILEEKGVIHKMDAISKLDEAPSAYKDIETVMENQSDLVDIVEKLEPILVVKN